LERQLRETRERLQATVEQLEVANEELASSNQELLSLNEQLLTSNEELRGSREEVQLVNHELQGVNRELETKVGELNRTHNDLKHLFRSTRIATIFLDRKLRIRTFTPSIRAVFRLLESDIGRPISDFASRSSGDTLIEDAERTLRTLKRVERTIMLENGAWH